MRADIKGLRVLIIGAAAVLAFAEHGAAAAASPCRR
jgi:hypothetical protein